MNPQEYIERQQGIQEARRMFPGVEIGEAFRRWKEGRGEPPSPKLSTGDKSLKEVKNALREGAKKPCTQEGCSGTMELESVCSGCVEGRMGYRSKWTCNKCLHRDLSKKESMEWLKELISGL